MHAEDLIEVERQLGFHYEMRRTRHRTLPVDLPAVPARAARPGAGRSSGGASAAASRRARRPAPVTPAHANPGLGEGPLGDEDADELPSADGDAHATTPLDAARDDPFGPHAGLRRPASRLDTGVEPDRIWSKTHCCFCGQQCGMHLKVKDKQVDRRRAAHTTSRSTRASSARRASSATCRATTRTGCSRLRARRGRAGRLPADRPTTRRSPASRARSSASSGARRATRWPCSPARA